MLLLLLIYNIKKIIHVSNRNTMSVFPQMSNSLVDNIYNGAFSNFQLVIVSGFYFCNGKVLMSSAK